MNMREIINNDLDLFISDWKEEVQPIVNGQPVDGVFDEPFTTASPLSGQIEASAPTLTLKTAAVPAGTAHGSPVVVRDTSYTVAGIQPDGSGLTSLILREA